MLLLAGCAQNLVCDSILTQPICPTTVVTCTCTVNGTFSSTVWKFLTLNPCPSDINSILLIQSFPCNPASGQCGPYLSAANVNPNNPSSSPCPISKLQITTNPTLSGLVFECWDYSTGGTSSGRITMTITG